MEPANVGPRAVFSQLLAAKALSRYLAASGKPAHDRYRDRLLRNRSPALFPLYSWSARASYPIVAVPGRCYGFKYLVVIRICSLCGIDSSSPYR